MIQVGIVGLGKMGLSHCSIANSHPAVKLVGLCDSSGYALDVLGKYSGIPIYSDLASMLSGTQLDAVIIATPSRTHADLARTSLDRGLAVFCEKPFTLSPTDAEQLTQLAASRGLVTQVGYHNRFVGAFQEVKRLLNAGMIGDVTHVLAEAYGPVVLKPKGGTWRTRRNEGGGCLYDYAAHVVNLVTWYIGEPVAVGGTVLNSVFSTEIDDEVASTLYYEGGVTAQVSANWSDESQRKMTTSLTLWGTGGRIYVDRQECQVFLRDSGPTLDGYEPGWNVKYTTELTEPVWFYLRGEEYSAQLDHFFSRVMGRALKSVNDFASATETDRVIGLMAKDAAAGPRLLGDGDGPVQGAPPRRRRLWSLKRRRAR